MDVVETTVEIGGLALSLVHPPDAEELIDEEAFEHEEFLPYWAELWPSAVALARALGERELEGSRVLELGCGLALPSIVAARRGAEVVATDWSPDALTFASRNAARNGVELDTLARGVGAAGAPRRAWAVAAGRRGGRALRAPQRRAASRPAPAARP